MLLGNAQNQILFAIKNKRRHTYFCVPTLVVPLGVMTRKPPSLVVSSIMLDLIVSDEELLLLLLLKHRAFGFALTLNKTGKLEALFPVTLRNAGKENFVFANLIILAAVLELAKPRAKVWKMNMIW